MAIRSYAVSGYYRYINEVYNRPRTILVGGVDLKSEAKTGKAGDSYVNNLTPVTRDEWYETITSVNSPGFYTKKKISVQWIPKKYPLSPPSYPFLNIPEFPVFKPKPSYSLGLRMKLYRKYLKRYAIVLEIRKRRIARFNAAVLRYNKRYAKYVYLLALKERGLTRYKRVRVTARELPMNPYSRTRTFDFGMSGYSLTSQGISDYWGGVLAPGPFLNQRICEFYKKYTCTNYGSPPVNLVTATESRAIKKLYKRLNEQQVHVGNLVAERAQTFSMISNIVKRVAEIKRNPFAFVKYFKQGSFSKNVSNDYLALKFGVEPLLNDAYGALQALARLASDQQSDKIDIRVSSTQSDRTQVRTAVDANNNYITYYVDQTVKVAYTLKYRVFNGATSELQKFGLLNPAEILWEVTPWSFVIDWFLPIGNYINSLSADAGCEFLTGTKTVVTRTLYRTEWRNTGQRYSTNNSMLTDRKIDAFKVVETKVRTVLTSAPKPRLPDFKSPVSMTHLAESLSLLIQRLRK